MSDAPLPDGLLLRRYRELGDEAAFAELRRRHERLVFSACRRETGDATLAEDAAQAAFLLLTRKSFPDDASLAGWLFGAARLVSKNLVREEGRRRRRERCAYQEPETPGEAWIAIEPHVNDALAALKAGDREAVLLRFGGERSLAEVGEALGVGENAARMRVARALERMRVHLRRAGVGVSVLLLASLLSTRLAEAAPAASGPPRARSLRAARNGAWALPLTTSWKPALLALVALAAVGGWSVARRPPRLSSAESAALFQAAEGDWRGTLEFVDDATGTRTKTAALVRADRAQGGLSLAARFAAFRVVDATTIVPQADGRYQIGTTGSHRLDGEYELVRLRDGSPAFLGYSLAVHADVRLRLRAENGTLTLQEEAWRGDAWRLRNRYDLRRGP